MHQTTAGGLQAQRGGWADAAHARIWQTSARKALNPMRADSVRFPRAASTVCIFPPRPLTLDMVRNRGPRVLHAVHGDDAAQAAISSISPQSDQGNDAPTR